MDQTNNKTMKSGDKGFSLVELLVVVTIISILAAVAMPAYIHHIYRIRESNGLDRLMDMQVAQEKFYALYDVYAQSTADTNYKSLLNFDPADTAIYIASFAAAGTATFTALLRSDLNNDGQYTNCWQISQPPNEPVFDTATAGCTNNEGFSLSLVGGLF